MKTSNFHQSKYLKSKDLDGPKVVVISEVTSETFKNSSDPKPLVYFKGMRKPLILNHTNTDTIEDIAGTDEMNDWPGVKVEIYPSTVEVNGETKDCIRVRPPDQAELPTRRPIKPTPTRSGRDAMDDEIPF